MERRWPSENEKVSAQTRWPLWMLGLPVLKYILSLLWLFSGIRVTDQINYSLVDKRSVVIIFKTAEG